MYTRKNTRWISITEYVDLETGELISLSRYKRENYYTVRTKSKTETKDGNTKIRRHTTECRRNKQTKIKFE